ncbi:dienelactone hydrolase family protein [Synechococcus sp. GFB01]|uniref:dienelactone hydrolase family protein n=1 Tax=Synechococcus sp. GFB01 TaxID=1662190 RepID=UPI00069CFA84|nr:dienelactone hydrolase family protein [Synechococcus sp. GFB01]
MAEPADAAPMAPCSSRWIEPQPGVRCWWALPPERPPRAAVLVLPEVFGVNAWVRGVADRLASEGFAALAWPIFWRTAPALELGYDEASLAEGRRHRDRLTADAFLRDAAAAIAWLQSQPGLEGRPVGCLGFCFGGHLAMLAATLPGVAATCDCYGARVSTDRPGGGPATLTVVPGIAGELLCVCGDQDPLMPPEELAAIRNALEPPHRLLMLPGAGHGFMCEARAAHRPLAAAAAWQAMLELFRRRL